MGLTFNRKEDTMNIDLTDEESLLIIACIQNSYGILKPDEIYVVDCIIEKLDPDGTL